MIELDEDVWGSRRVCKGSLGTGRHEILDVGLLVVVWWCKKRQVRGIAS